MFGSVYELILGQRYLRFCLLHSALNIPIYPGLGFALGNLFIYLPSIRPIYPSVYLSVHLTIHHFAILSIHHPSIYPSIHPSIHPSCS